MFSKNMMLFLFGLQVVSISAESFELDGHIAR